MQAGVKPAPAAAPRRAGPAQLVFGGALAAFLGFLGAWVWLDQPGDDSALTARIDALEAQIAALPAAPEAADLGPITAAQTETATRIDALGARIDAADSTRAEIDARLTAVERAPAPDGGVTETAIASIEREIVGLRTEITGQNARLEEVASGAAATLAANAAEAEAAQAAAAAEARATEARAALAQVRAAIDTGTPFAEPLAALEAAGTAIPAPLAAAAETGAPSVAALQAGFPDAARAALEAARGDDDAGGIIGFFDGMTQRRSVTPQEGDSVDAVQSRAEAALRAGDLEAALAEIGALQGAPAEAFASWRDAAMARQQAVAATDAVAAEIDTLSPQNQ